MQGELVPNTPAAVPEAVSATVPAGDETMPVLASTTVAVQTDPWPTRTVDGVHETAVVVGRRFTVSVAELLPGPATLVAVTSTVNEGELARA